jgi:hypothetical protein
MDDRHFSCITKVRKKNPGSKQFFFFNLKNFMGGDFSHCHDRKKPQCELYKGFFGEKKLQKSPYFEGEKRSHIAIFRQLVSIKW